MIRAIFSDNGTVTDYTKEMREFNENTFSFDYTTAEDYLYIGMKFPFNQIYFDLTSLNIVDTNMKVEMWDDTEWRDVVDLMDFTNGFKKPGYVQFTIDKDYSYSRSNTNYAGQTVTGLTDLNIYDQYWIRISFDETLTTNVTLKWIGHRFCDDTDIADIYPELNTSNMKTAFKTGKTDWKEQSILASNEVIKKLKKRQKLYFQEQILDWTELTNACVHKLAELVFIAFGDNYDNDRIKAKSYFKEEMKDVYPKTDDDLDGREDIKENGFKERFLWR